VTENVEHPSRQRHWACSRAERELQGMAVPDGGAGRKVAAFAALLSLILATVSLLCTNQPAELLATSLQLSDIFGDQSVKVTPGPTQHLPLARKISAAMKKDRAAPEKVLTERVETQKKAAPKVKKAVVVEASKDHTFKKVKSEEHAAAMVDAHTSDSSAEDMAAPQKKAARKVGLVKKAVAVEASEDHTVEKAKSEEHAAAVVDVHASDSSAEDLATKHKNARAVFTTEDARKVYNSVNQKEIGRQAAFEHEVAVLREAAAREHDLHEHALSANEMHGEKKVKALSERFAQSETREQSQAEDQADKIVVKPLQQLKDEAEAENYAMAREKEFETSVAKYREAEKLSKKAFQANLAEERSAYAPERRVLVQHALARMAAEDVIKHGSIPAVTEAERQLDFKNKVKEEAQKSAERSEVMKDAARTALKRIHSEVQAREVQEAAKERQWKLKRMDRKAVKKLLDLTENSEWPSLAFGGASR